MRSVIQMECDSARQKMEEKCEENLVVEDNTQERTMDREATIVINVTQLSELVHEQIDLSTRGSDHFRQHLL